jgi:hypothetical protein
MQVVHTNYNGKISWKSAALETWNDYGEQNQHESYENNALTANTISPVVK